MSNKVTARTSDIKYKTEIQSVNHTFISDEPLDLDGGDLGPNPGEYLSAALAACTSITVKMYAERSGWKLDEVHVEVDYARDDNNKITKFIKHIVLIGDLDEKQKDRLFKISQRCPIQRLLEGPIEIESEFSENAI